MRLVVLHDIIRLEEKMIVKAATNRGVEVRLTDVRRLVLNSRGDLPDELQGPVLQRCLSYYRGLHATAFIELKGGFVVNSLYTTLISGNKLFTTLALERAGVPTPTTLTAFSHESALEAFKTMGRAVIKPVMGSWGRLVALLDNLNAAKAVIEDREEMYPLYQVYYLQEYVDRPPRDIRTFVVGDEVVAAIYRYEPPDDWRTNTARGGRAEPCPITKELEDISLKASKAVGGGVLGVDLMETNNGFVVHEVNHSVEFRNSVKATGVDIAGKIVDYVVSSYKR